MIEIAAWQDAELSFTLEYAPPAFERVRQSAAEGMIALPRVGMGVGGLLLGERTAAGIRVTDTLELPCSHTLGPAFQLTPNEIRESLELVRVTAAQRPVVGIYCTRTRGVLAMGATDRELFDLLCPEYWQIALALRPAPGEPTRAAVFFRKVGEVVQGTVRELWDWRPAEPDDAQADQFTAQPPPAPQPKALPPPPASVIPMPAPAVSLASAASAGNAVPPAVIEMPLPRPVPAATPVMEVSPPAMLIPPPPQPKKAQVNSQFVTDPAREPRAFPIPSAGTLFGQPAGPPLLSDAPPASKTPRRLLALAAVLVGLAVGAGMFATKDAWLPRPPLTLTCTDTNGMLEIRWNASAARGLDHGSLLINDGGGGQLDTVPLDPVMLLSGSFLYKRKSDRVTVTLDLGNERARTAFPLEPDSAGANPARDATTLPNPPQSDAISAFGNPPASGDPAGTAPVVAPPGGTAPAQEPGKPAAPPGR